MTEIPRRILIVDDDMDILNNLSDILTDAGYDTVTAHDGTTAIQKVGFDSGRKFDLCLLDFKMPDMDGSELMVKLHQQQPNLRAIMITAFAGEDGVQRSIAAGTWKVLPKPVDVQLLLELIAS